MKNTILVTIDTEAETVEMQVNTPELNVGMVSFRSTHHACKRKGGRDVAVEMFDNALEFIKP